MTQTDIVPPEDERPFEAVRRFAKRALLFFSGLLAVCVVVAWWVFVLWAVYAAIAWLVGLVTG